MEITKDELSWFMIDSLAVGCWIGIFVFTSTPLILIGLLNVAASIIRFRRLGRIKKERKK